MKTLKFLLTDGAEIQSMELQLDCAATKLKKSGQIAIVDTFYMPGDRILPPNNYW